MRKLMALAFTAIVVLSLAVPALADGDDDEGNAVARATAQAN
jgi:hypothetical protein